MEVISLKEALEMIDNYNSQGYAKVNDVVFVMLNKSKSTSDGFIRLDKAVKVTRRLKKTERAKMDRENIAGKKIGGITKTPNHRFLQHKYGSQKMLVHVDNILIINGKAVR